MQTNADSAVAAVYRAEWNSIVATMIRLVGDFDVAEESTQEAFAAAVDAWRTGGIPSSPRAWIVQTARHKAIDRLRRQKRFTEKLHDIAGEGVDQPEQDVDAIKDDRLRLIFTCCHPALAQEAQVALTLRLLGGLETEEIARAFLVPTATMAQRLVRAKRKIRDAKIPYVTPEVGDMPQRLDSVLHVLYLIFNEGYSATRGDSLVRGDLCVEAIRLARLINSLLEPKTPSEAIGLLALMLLHDSRRAARLDSAGDIVLLEDQDRRLWNRKQIAEALRLVASAFQGEIGPYSLQAAIAAEHCRAPSAAETNWPRIVELYRLLEYANPSPIVALNRAAAVAMVDGPAAGLEIVEQLTAGGELQDYYLLHAVRADFLRRLGRNDEAADAYRQAIGLVENESERRFLRRRLDELT